MSQIVVIATPGCYVASIGAVMDAHVRLGEIYANNPAMHHFAKLEPALQLVALTGDRIALAGGQELRATGRLDQCKNPRAIYLPSFQSFDTDRLPPFGRNDEALYAWLSLHNARGVPIAACGAGTRHLAAAGLLDRAQVSVHPRHADYVRRLSPTALIEIGGGVAGFGNIWTCAREADAMHLVLKLFGAAYAVEVSNDLDRIEPVPGFENPRSLSPDYLVAQAQMWMRDHFTQSFRIQDLAQLLEVSHATLIRRFETSVHMTPRNFVQNLRVTAAAVMLTETGRQPSEIAHLVGYADQSAFRKVFRAAYGVSPAVYRREQLRRRIVDGARMATDRA